MTNEDIYDWFEFMLVKKQLVMTDISPMTYSHPYFGIVAQKEPGGMYRLSRSLSEWLDFMVFDRDWFLKQEDVCVWADDRLSFQKHYDAEIKQIDTKRSQIIGQGSSEVKVFALMEAIKEALENER